MGPGKRTGNRNQSSMGPGKRTGNRDRSSMGPGWRAMWSPGRAALCWLLLESLLQPAGGLNLCLSGSAASCEECLLIHPSCAWCSQEDFGRSRTASSRCDLEPDLLRRGCLAPNIEHPTSGLRVLENRPLSSTGAGPGRDQDQDRDRVVQILPQRLELSLRPGDPARFGLQVRQVEDYPVDLYYLMDLSLSMKDDLVTIRTLGTNLAQEMGKLTSNFRLGFGAFVDKNMSPFSYTAPKYQENPCSGECIECRLFDSGRLADNQTTCQRLCRDQILTVESLKPAPGSVLCVFRTEDDCVMRFTYSEHASGQSVLTALQQPECPSGPAPLQVLLAVGGSILLGGLLLLGGWKLLITLHDRREFSRFQSARTRARYEMASNPLYKQPVTTHFLETDFSAFGKSYNGGVL
ncbi:integrin beta-5 [Menidia menidia]